MNIVSQLAKHKQMLKKDLATFLTMDTSFSKSARINTKHGTESIDIKLRPGKVSSQKDLTVTLDGELIEHNWKNKRIPLIKARITKDDKMHLEYLQDSDIHDKPTSETYTISHSDYHTTRNQIFHHLHHSISQKKGIELIRNFIKSKVEQ